MPATFPFSARQFARPFQAAGGASTLNDNLVEYWTLDEASGNATGAVESIALTETGGTVGSATGLVHATARDFEDADTEYLGDTTGGAGAVAGISAFTFAAWVKPESLVAFMGVFTSNNANTFQLIYRDSTRWRFECAGVTQDLTVSPITAGTWYLLVCGYSDADNTMFLSQNGAAKTSVANSSSKSTTANTFIIGYGVGPSYWDGLIGPVAVWSRILTDSEISELWNSGDGKPGPSF